MNRGLLLFLIIFAVLVYFGIKVKRTNRTLATALFTVAACLFLLMTAGFFGWIGG
jgi:hypothetical protein